MILQSQIQLHIKKTRAPGGSLGLQLTSNKQAVLPATHTSKVCRQKAYQLVMSSVLHPFVSSYAQSSSLWLIEEVQRRLLPLKQQELFSFPPSFCFGMWLERSVKLAGQKGPEVFAFST